MTLLGHSPRQASPRVFVDISTSLFRADDPPVGITRVEGQIARRLLARPELHPVPVVFRDGSLFALSLEQAARIFSGRPRGRSQELRLREPVHRAGSLPEAAPSLGAADHIPMPMHNRLRRKATAGMKRLVKGGVERMPQAIQDDVRDVLIHSRQILWTLAKPAAPSSHPVQSSPREETKALRDEILPGLRSLVHPAAGDVLWTAGLYSNFVPLRRIAELRDMTKLRVVTTCYDLIRIDYPEFNAASLAAGVHTANTLDLLDASDLVLAISEWTRRELLSFAARSQREAPPVEVVTLGSDPVSPVTPTFGAEHPVLQHFARRRFALAVGTVEPRKNLGLLLRVWEQLAADPAFELDLVIVGRPGYEAEASVAEIETSPLFANRVFWLPDCPDEALHWLYDACHVVLCPSLVEGWGLSVTEGLSYGRQVIASDRAAHPEAGLGLARLLDPTDAELWQAAVRELASAPRQTIAVPSLPSWDSAAAAVAAHLSALLGARQAA